MIVIGLTGGIAVGKSTVATMLKNANIPVIDADFLAREVTKVGSVALREIVETFGQNILKGDHTLDRQRLAKIVFTDKNLLNKLEAIIHPKIEELYKIHLNELAELGHKIIVYMAPLIFEKRLHLNFTKTLLIIANDNVRRQRIIKRDNMSIDEMEKRIEAQLDDKIKISLADEVIENNGTLDELYKNLSLAWTRLTKTKLAPLY